MTQRQINAAFRRSLKTSYKSLLPCEYRLVKAQEQIDALNKSIVTEYRLGKLRYGPAFRKHPGFQPIFKLIFEWEEWASKLRTRIGRLEDKYNLDRAEVLKRHYLNNRARFYGGSY